MILAGRSFLDPFMLFMFHVCLCYAVLSDHCSLMVTCWERADLLTLFCVVLSCVLSLSLMCLVHIRTKREVGTVKHV